MQCFQGSLGERHGERQRKLLRQRGFRRLQRFGANVPGGEDRAVCAERSGLCQKDGIAALRKDFRRVGEAVGNCLRKCQRVNLRRFGQTKAGQRVQRVAAQRVQRGYGAEGVFVHIQLDFIQPVRRAAGLAKLGFDARRICAARFCRLNGFCLGFSTMRAVRDGQRSRCADAKNQMRAQREQTVLAIHIGPSFAHLCLGDQPDQRVVLAGFIAYNRLADVAGQRYGPVCACRRSVAKRDHAA